jgi:GGDEF domain-containing protein
MHLDVLLPEPATVVPAAIPLEAIAPGEVEPVGIEPVGIEPVGIEPKETEASAVEVEAAPEETQGEALEAEPKVVEMPLPAHARADEEEALLVPGGIHPPEVLNALLRSEATFQGVTLSISVVDYVRLVAEHGKGSVEQVMGALEGLVQTSGNPADLVCRISEDEFIVVCPGATGAAATSRVQQLSENLWDFQLRSLVSFPILFSWGASESGLMPGMPRVLADSVDRAREQMLETRRSRRALTWESAKYGLRSNAG